GFFPSYYCYTVVREDTLKKYPELESVLLMMENIITDSDMAALNYEVEGHGREDVEVAKEFLVNKGFLQ
ncbi:MAG: glycine betaine ABC transporter substrate-binding protein, partial [Turicibacter sp.]